MKEMLILTITNYVIDESGIPDSEKVKAIRKIVVPTTVRQVFWAVQIFIEKTIIPQWNENAFQYLKQSYRDTTSRIPRS